jgi:iron(III) transport system permease protein
MAALSPVAIAARRLSVDAWVQLGAMLVLIGWLAITIAFPLGTLLSRGFLGSTGEFVGLKNFAAYLSSPAMVVSVLNSLTVALITTALVLPIAFVYAYGLTRSLMPARGLFGGIAMIPILAPSLLPAIALVYLFGNQGLLRGWLFGQPVYGPVGIVIAMVFYCFPHAVLILTAALGMADARLYDAATSLGASRWRAFRTVTLPGARYGLASAGFVVFTLAVTDFGIPKVIGGRYHILATDVYKQVIGQQNLEMGAVVGMVLLAPALLSFVVERLVRRRQVALLSARAVPLSPTPRPAFDRMMAAICAVIAAPIVGLVAVAAWGSFITFWPYNRALTLANYRFGAFDASGWASYWNSVEMAVAAAVVGPGIIFVGAYLVEKGRGLTVLRVLASLLALLPLAVPGLVLGLGYILFFNQRGNPFNGIYGTMTILVVNTIAHFYTVAHLIAATALKHLDREFEAVSASLKVPVHRTFWRVTVPICVPAILDMGVYLFVNAMTTVSAVIFLYSTDTKLASVASVSMNDTGATAAAAAMAMMIVYTSAGVKGLQVLLARALDRRTQAWRQREASR